MTTYEFSADPDRLDVAWIHGILSGTYWARGRSRVTMTAIIGASRNYGVYADGGDQVAYARAVTDGVTFAWVADVIVDPAHRRQGLGTQIVDGLMADLESLGLKRVLLKASPEGQELYRRAGFDRLDDPETWLGRRLR
ncbi:GNAT family N-acetyltransferase [Isoptericola sp. 178]|uniref:GNAT family N-acetyltransferase n=1 Tax=Isoptericola sp. 178 TaxID=3064651 RepID=UPI0027131D60|nr:GNAT family N-acetyltransferase [Isoptericola sp. 178]MDO8145174.1 GNAT family N-acetyltransferase [Isoptericola sp. 178]